MKRPITHGEFEALPPDQQREEMRAILNQWERNAHRELNDEHQRDYRDYQTELGEPL